MIAIWTADEPVSHSSCDEVVGTVLDDDRWESRRSNDEPAAGRFLDDHGKSRSDDVAVLDYATAIGHIVLLWRGSQR